MVDGILLAVYVLVSIACVIAGVNLILFSFTEERETSDE